MERGERQPEGAGTADKYLLKYCFGRPALLLTEEQTRVYIQMMLALNQSPYEIRKAS